MENIKNKQQSSTSDTKVGSSKSASFVDNGLAGGDVVCSSFDPCHLCSEALDAGWRNLVELWSAAVLILSGADPLKLLSSQFSQSSPSETLEELDELEKLVIGKFLLEMRDLWNMKPYPHQVQWPNWALTHEAHSPPAARRPVVFHGLQRFHRHLLTLKMAGLCWHALFGNSCHCHDLLFHVRLQNDPAYLQHDQQLGQMQSRLEARNSDTNASDGADSHGLLPILRFELCAYAAVLHKQNVLFCPNKVPALVAVQQRWVWWAQAVTESIHSSRSDTTRATALREGHNAQARQQ